MARDRIGNARTDHHLRRHAAAQVNIAIDRLGIDDADLLKAAIFRSFAAMAQLTRVARRESDGEINFHERLSPNSVGSKSLGLEETSNIVGLLTNTWRVMRLMLIAGA